MNQKTLRVQKYGGASLADPGRILKVAASVQRSWQQGHSMVIVVSAMGKTTNDLIRLAHQIDANPSPREMDMLLSAGERMSMSLFSMALQSLNVPALSLTGSQAGILTSEEHSKAEILDVKAPRVQEALAQNKVVVLAGFQGVSPKTKEITTLGRGGSDLTAVAMAAALRASCCEILKDVAGIYSADPHEVTDARVLSQMTLAEFAEMTLCGAKVLQYRAASLARAKNIPLYIGSAEDEDQTEGTHVVAKIEKERPAYLSVNSHDALLQVPHLDLFQLNTIAEQKKIVAPDLFYQTEKLSYLSGPFEVLQAFAQAQSLEWENHVCSSVSVQGIEGANFTPFERLVTAPLSSRRTQNSWTVFVPQTQRRSLLNEWHLLITR